jgi:hypothetical protein
MTSSNMTRTIFNSAPASLIFVISLMLITPISKAQSKKGPAQVENQKARIENQKAAEEQFKQDKEESRKDQTTNLVYFNCGTGLEALQYSEFSDVSPVNSWSVSLSWVTSCMAVGRVAHLGILARGVFSPVGIAGTERWFTNGDLIQKNDLLYRLNRLVLGIGYVSSGGLEPYLGYWYEDGRQTRENFSPPDPLRLDQVSVEKIKSEGLVLGLEGVYYRTGHQSISHFYSDLIIPIHSTATNTLIPGAELQAPGVGFEGGASIGKIYGEGKSKWTVGIQANLIVLYYNGQTRRDIPGYVFVEWPRNLTFGSSLILQIGGGWFSVFEK